MGFVLTILYIVVTIISPEQFGPDLSTYHALTYFAILTALASLPSMSDHENWKKCPQTFLLCGLVVAIALSQVVHGYLGGVAEAMRVFLPSAAVYFFIIANVTTTRRLKIATSVAILACLGLAIESLFGYYAGYHDGLFVFVSNVYSQDGEAIIGQLFRIRGAGFLSDPNDFAQILLIAVPLAFMFWRKGHRITNTLLVLAPCAVLLWTTYLTHSRGGLLALAAILLFVCRKKLGTTTSIAIAAFLILAMLSLDFTGGRGISAADGADRLDAWASGLEMFKTSPLFGIGFGNFADLNLITAHNSFVLCLAELGLLGSVLWLALLVTTTLDLNRIIGGKRKRRERTFGLLPLFEANYIGRSFASVPAAPLTPEPAMAFAVAGISEPIQNPAVDAAAVDADVDAENIRIVPQQCVNVLRIALVSFMVSSWFLSRSYSTTMYLILGLATAAIAIERTRGSLREQTNWILLTAELEVVLMFVIYILVRFRH